MPHAREPRPRREVGLSAAAAVVVALLERLRARGAGPLGVFPSPHQPAPARAPTLAAGSAAD